MIYRLEILAEQNQAVSRKKGLFQSKNTENVEEKNTKNIHALSKIWKM